MVPVGSLSLPTKADYRVGGRAPKMVAPIDREPKPTPARQAANPAGETFCQEKKAVKPVFNEDELRGGVAGLARRISADWCNSADGDRRPLVVVGVLTGCVIMLADLVRQLEMPMRIGFVRASSYRGKTTHPGSVIVRRDMLPDICGQDVLIVDDIFDTGQTLRKLTTQLTELGPRSIKSAVLLRKRGRRKVDLNPDYVGLETPDQFVVGYGLDYNDMYRNLPYLAALEPHELDEGTG